MGKDTDDEMEDINSGQYDDVSRDWSEDEDDEEFKGGGKGQFTSARVMRKVRFDSDIDRTKTTMCTRWSKGGCDRGATCGFAHGSYELRRVQTPDGTYTGPPWCNDMVMGKKETTAATTIT